MREERKARQLIVDTDRLLLWSLAGNTVGFIHESLLDMTKVPSHKLVDEWKDK